mmetsp:Transcript_10942/g.23142  ORF Transcript_10942/g.23142 Transcript_10942/m.23142 type:complete len:257 (-) Transcript_10942:978-1748(-)
MMLSQMNLGEDPSKITRRIHNDDNKRLSRKNIKAKNEANIVHLIEQVSRVEKIGVPKKVAVSNPPSRCSLGYQRKGSSNENSSSIVGAAKKLGKKDKQSPSGVPREIRPETPVLPSIECSSHTSLSLSALKFQLDSLAYESASYRSVNGKKCEPDRNTRTRSSSLSNVNGNMNIKTSFYRRSRSNTLPPPPPPYRTHNATMPPPPPRRSGEGSSRPRSSSFNSAGKRGRKVASGFIPPPPPPRPPAISSYGLDEID